jgi:Protein of unknown function (DUF1645)
MDTSAMMNLTVDPPPAAMPHRPSFTEPTTPVHYFSDFEPADEGHYDSAEEDFSFVFSAPRPSKSPDITADELFSQGRLLPLYPIFSKFIEEKSTRNELDTFETASTSHPESTLSDRCEWVPKSAPSSPCRKSRSTGSARKWIFHDFLAGARSHSDGKEKFVFLDKPARTRQAKDKSKNKAPVQAKPPHTKSKMEKSAKVDNSKKDGNGKKEVDLATAYKSLYGMGRDKGKLKEGEKRKSFLPYFGFFGGGLNAFTKTSYPY